MKKIMLMSAALLLASTQLVFANAMVQEEGSVHMGAGGEAEVTSETSAQSDTGNTGGTAEPSSGVAIPKFIDITTEAKKAAEKADIGAVRSGITAGRRQYEPIIIRKRIDKASPLLAKAIAGCETTCSAQVGSDDLSVREACEDRCVADFEVKNPRDAASGLATGRVRSSYNVKANVKARLSMDSQEREEAMAEHKAEMEARWESRKEAMDDWHTQLKARLATFKDKTKAEIAERIQTNLDALNARMTAHFDTQLETMVSIMVRVAAGDVNGDGAAEIAAANDAIASAQAANDDQADNTYPVSVSSETTVKADVGAARQKLHDDLKKVSEEVKAAREAVRASYDLALGKKV
jgi:hypothetical protein